ncbi:MAG: fimbrial protein [Alcaligenes faecalis]|uniref:fimbrial protein n=1 Tax=Alcaligenes TaxID=507 RepID=UPI000E866C92|nr:fimbrial protein [Alcaligenes faecalis]MCH4224195.1 fimbrial protein [Alcaligenes faecalis]HBQ91308.1 adhesin [Alcaligenes faecalis]
MKKILLGLTILSAFAAAGAQAEPVLGARGNISFIGSINADSCTVRTPGASSSGANMLVDMGPVSAKTLGTEAVPATSEGGLTSIAKNIDMQVECASGTKVELKLAPTTTSGKGIAVTGGAQNVQIMLLSNENVLDFTGGSATLEAPYVNGSINIPLTAYYTRKAGTEVADVVGGQANATVAYELSYE